MQSTKATNILLAIIAVCLVAIAMKPAGFLPEVSAQMSREDARERLSSISVTDKSIQQQVDAMRSIAAAIEKLADSGENIATSIEEVSRSLTRMTDRMAESSAAGSVVRTTPNP